MVSIPKGTKDVLPQDSYKWQYIESVAREVAREFNVKEIRTPMFEHTEVFLRGVGETTDIVNKEMYTFNDKGNRSITLKPEGTAGVARSFVENGMQSSALPVKMYYITPCFRYERPQAGRLREFHQFGVEFIGTEKPSADAEAIILAKTFLERLGVKELTLYLNSIGCKECRAKYHVALKKYLKKHYDDLCDLCKERYEKNPLRILDCKNPECNKITAKAPKMLDYLCDDCKAHFESVKTLLDKCNVEYKINPDIVRGLDYYTKTVFEFVSNSIGAQGTVCGGGRYDGLISEFGGGNVAGIGFATGIERLLLVLENSEVAIPRNDRIKVYLAPIGEEAGIKAFTLTDKLRKSGIIAETDHAGRGIKAQFKYADKIGAEYVGVIGTDELNAGAVKVKRMADGEESLVLEEDLANFLEQN